MSVTAVDPAAGAEEELAELCGQLNAVTARIVEVIADLHRREAWGATGCKTLTHWVSWTCGVSTSRAASLAAVARRGREFPKVMALFHEGRLSEDQVAAVARRAPAGTDDHFAELAQVATVSQLRRALRIATPPRPADDQGRSEPERSISAYHDDDGTYRLRLAMPSAEAAPIDTALGAALDSLMAEWRQDRDGADVDPHLEAPMPTGVDALLRMAELSLSAETAVRPHHRRTKVIVHVDADQPAGRLHLGPGLSDDERRWLTCDATYETLIQRAGVPLGIGRTDRHIPARLRTYVEDRDQGCQVPGCGATRGLHLHHIVHWEDGGPTESHNLLAVCPFHHRLHHQGKLGVTGNADQPDGVTFTNRHGDPIRPASAARPPNGPAPPHRPYAHPTGEPADWHWYHPPAA